MRNSILRFSTVAIIFAGLIAFAAEAFAESWKFGVMSDTQWKIGVPDPVNCPKGDTKNCDGKNPNSVAVGIINELNKEFIRLRVKFVIHTGDITDKGDALALDTTATFMQALYNAGIGYYPLRGNHDGSQAAAVEFRRLFPQTRNGVNNQTPADAIVNTECCGTLGPKANSGFTVGSNFVSFSSDFEGLTYSFDYQNARFVLLDQFTPPSGTAHSTLSTSEVDWVGSRLSSRAPNTHAFVFGHKHMISENHQDTLFGKDPSSDSVGQNLFLAQLQKNGVRYYMGGHDHMHNRSIVISPDKASTVQDIINSSNSYKFYIPRETSNDEKYDLPAFGSLRETPISQELFRIGYYIVTVDGPRVTVDYYSSPNGCNGDCDLVQMPEQMKFSKRESFGYSLNGKEFLVHQGEPYSVVQDSFEGTTAKILGGTNGSKMVDFNGRPLTKVVDTGWSADSRKTLASNILTIWGMTKNLGACSADNQNCNPKQTVNVQPIPVDDRTDVYTLSMTYDEKKAGRINLADGAFGLVARDADGKWVNAVAMNSEGAPKFIAGPWKPEYGLGTYGIDPKTKTAWAVIDHNGDFAVGKYAAVAEKKGLP
jgi:3',5'-cyclic AMP phosphodiesterase CpdA